MAVELLNDGEIRASIDPLRLDKEWLDQPQMYINQADRTARAQLKYDEAASDLKRTKAELDRDIRDNPAKFGINKLTEAIVEQTIYAQPEYHAADSAVNSMRFNLNLENGRLEGLQQKKRALTMLVELWVREYYSDAGQKTPTSMTDFEKESVRRRGQRRVEEREEAKREDTDHG